MSVGIGTGDLRGAAAIYREDDGVSASGPKAADRRVPSMIITFFVPGVPRPAGSKRGIAIRKRGVFTGQVAVVDANPNSLEWKTAVTHYARTVFTGEPLTGPIRLTVELRMPRPAGHYGSGKNIGRLRDGSPKYPTVRPDATKCLRCLEDALSKVIWRDDAQIVDQIVLKRYSEKPGAWVEVEPL